MEIHEELLRYFYLKINLHLGRGTNTGLAIRWVVDNAFRPEFGDRPEVPNKVLLITDGRARDPPILRVEAARLQVNFLTQKLKNINIFSTIKPSFLNH